MTGCTIDSSFPEKKLDEYTETATFAGGCFWCIEPSYDSLESANAQVGYAGGTKDSANYLEVSKGETAHREAVQVSFNPEKISYEKLVQIFFEQIDPTDSGGQFADRGFHYTTAIYYHSQEQKNIAEKLISHLENSGKFNSPIAVKIEEFTTFFPAEEYHQNYYKKAAEHYARYKKGSGRENFISENWAKDAAVWEMEQLESEYIVSEEEKIKAQLDPLSYHVIFENGTEKPFENDYWNNKAKGIYVDKITKKALFSSTHKYDSGTGWPSFYKTIDESSVSMHEDSSHGMARTEIRSEGGHLGHVFPDGPKEQGGIRFCTNSASLLFIPFEEMEEVGYGEYLYLFERN